MAFNSSAALGHVKTRVVSRSNSNFPLPLSLSVSGSLDYYEEKRKKRKERGKCVFHDSFSELYTLCLFLNTLLIKIVD